MRPWRQRMRFSTNRDCVRKGQRKHTPSLNNQYLIITSTHAGAYFVTHCDPAIAPLRTLPDPTLIFQEIRDSCVRAWGAKMMASTPPQGLSHPDLSAWLCRTHVLLPVLVWQSTYTRGFAFLPFALAVLHGSTGHQLGSVALRAACG